MNTYFTLLLDCINTIYKHTSILRYFFIGIVMGLLLIFLFLSTTPDGNVHIILCPGETGSLYVRFPKGHDMLILRGNSSTASFCLGRYKPFWDRQLDLLVVPVKSAEKIQEVLDVIKRYRVENVIADQKTLSTLNTQTASKHTPFGGFPNITSAQVTDGVFVLKNIPTHDFLPTLSDQTTHRAVMVFRLEYGHTSAVIVTGGFSKEVELAAQNSLSNQSKRLLIILEPIDCLGLSDNTKKIFQRVMCPFANNGGVKGNTHNQTTKEAKNQVYYSNGLSWESK